MQIVLGISEGSWVDIGVVVVPIILVGLGTFAYLKIKSKIMVDVKKEIDEKIEPIEKRMDKHDADFKDFKHDEFEPMKQNIQELITTTSVLKTQMGTVIDGQAELKKEFKSNMGKLESLIGKIFDKLDMKKDK